VIFIIINSLTG